MKDVVKESIEYLYDVCNDVVYPETGHVDLKILEKYISYLEQLVLSSSDCSQDYRLVDLRKDFKEECL